MKKHKYFDWIIDCENAIIQLKYALLYCSVLSMPDFDANFAFETDTSDIAVGAVSMQHDWPVAFMSKALSSAQCNYHTMDHKLLVVVIACKRWCHYIYSKKTIVLTDHKPHIGLYTAPNLNKRYVKWFEAPANTPVQLVYQTVA